MFSFLLQNECVASEHGHRRAFICWRDWHFPRELVKGHQVICCCNMLKLCWQSVSVLFSGNENPNKRKTTENNGGFLELHMRGKRLSELKTSMTNDNISCIHRQNKQKSRWKVLISFISVSSLNFNTTGPWTIRPVCLEKHNLTNQTISLAPLGRPLCFPAKAPTINSPCWQTNNDYGRR